jgi:hypothetical protein
MARPDGNNVQERALGELFGELSQDIGLLLRQETQLAKTEMQSKLSSMTKSLVAFASGGAVVLVGGLALSAALILLLIDPVGLTPWLAAAVVGVLFGVIGATMLRGALGNLKRTDPVPRRTAETIKDDIQWAKEQTS